MVYVTHDQVEAMTLGDVIVVMEQGRIRQADPPHDTYLRPADPFVAGFIGTPPMYLWSGALDRRDNGWVFRRGSLEVSVPSLRTDVPGHTGAGVILGVRPEDIRIEPTVEASVHLDAAIDVSEDLGADQILHCSVMGEPVIVRVSQHPPIPPGRRLSLYIPPEKWHLFHENRRIN
jgi:ABC-type sugar transport system ATPase subunit